MLAILNGLSSLGRILPGLVGDRLGYYDILLVMIVFTIICTAATLTAFGSTCIEVLYAFSAFWGFGTGLFLSLAPGKLSHSELTPSWKRFCILSLTDPLRYQPVWRRLMKRKIMEDTMVRFYYILPHLSVF